MLQLLYSNEFNNLFSSLSYFSISFVASFSVLAPPLFYRGGHGHGPVPTCSKTSVPVPVPFLRFLNSPVPAPVRVPRFPDFPVPGPVLRVLKMTVSGSGSGFRLCGHYFIFS